ncbi:MAG: hypothetical protein N3I35_18155 [Clostridia bacterium]|nr:hypothetical protein [Clostridia bacterium]
MEKAKLIFENYNHIIEKGYDKILSGFKGDDILKLGEEKINSLLKGDIKEWEHTPIPSLDGLSPKEFFYSLNDLAHTMEIFRMGAEICDKDLPEVFLDRLEYFGESVVEELLKLSVDTVLINSSENYFIPILSIRTLGRLKKESAIEPLLDMAYKLNEENENLVEEINDALVAIGKPVINHIIDRIMDQKRIGYIDEYVLNALVRVGKDNKSDEIFRCLKEAFAKMDDRILGALCLSDYGDGRAIPALRGFLEKNRASVDRQTYLEIAAAIKRLGGNIDDLI